MSAPVAKPAFFVDEPMVLVSQMQRSGGSLLSQLFDGHPQVYANPHDLRIGKPKGKKEWPDLDLTSRPAEWFRQLKDRKWKKLGRAGFFGKPGQNPHAADLQYPFTFDQHAQGELFLQLAAEREVRSQRDILDCYWTSFFASWAEWQPTGREVVVSGFMPRVVGQRGSMERFRRDYPDGRLISIVRDPVSWYASTSRHNPDHADVRAAVHEWSRNVRAIGDLVRAREEWATGVLFADLVSEPEAVMRRLAAFSGIEWHPCLLEQTFLGQPMLPNSSFAIAEPGINKAVAERTDVDPEARAYLEVEAVPLYEELAELLAAR